MQAAGRAMFAHRTTFVTAGNTHTHTKHRCQPELVARPGGNENRCSPMSHQMEKRNSVVFAHRIAFTPWMTLQTSSQAVMQRLATLKRPKCTGNRATRRAVHMKETTGSSVWVIRSDSERRRGGAGLKPRYRELRLKCTCIHLDLGA